MSDYAGISKIQQLLNLPNVTGTKSDYKDHTDPRYIGPGYWVIIHKKAFEANTIEKQKAFVEFVKDACYTFPCNNCREHCTEYIKQFDPSVYIGKVILDELGQSQIWGMFIWAWQFHNAVNQRIGKPQMEFITALDLHSKLPEMCGPGCLETEKAEHKVPVKRTFASLPDVMPTINLAEIREVKRE